jgi:hypothetical protein
MWGTDWTRAVKLLTYKEGVEAFRVTDRLENAEGSAHARVRRLQAIDRDEARLDSP